MVRKGISIIEWIATFGKEFGVLILKGISKLTRKSDVKITIRERAKNSGLSDIRKMIVLPISSRQRSCIYRFDLSLSPNIVKLKNKYENNIALKFTLENELGTLILKPNSFKHEGKQLRKDCGEFCFKWYLLKQISSIKDDQDFHIGTDIVFGWRSAISDNPSDFTLSVKPIIEFEKSCLINRAKRWLIIRSLLLNKTIFDIDLR